MKSLSYSNRGHCRKKRIGLFYTIFVFLCLLSPLPGHAGQAVKANILTSFLPIYIFTKNIVGDRKGVSVDLLIPGDVSPHDYHLRPSDMKMLERADAVIINGLGMEEFLIDAMKGKKSSRPPFESAAGLPLIPDKWGDHDHGHDHAHSQEFNPHVWVSPKMAMLQVDNIINFMSSFDPDGEDTYRRNGEAYIQKLRGLQIKMEEAVKGTSKRKVVTFHSAFDYLARDLGLEIADVIYKATVDELSAAEMARLINLIKTEQIGVIFSEPQFPGRMAELLAKESGAEVYSLDPLDTGKMDADYYERVMMNNLSVLKTALK